MTVASGPGVTVLGVLPDEQDTKVANNAAAAAVRQKRVFFMGDPFARLRR
jgi:hypothetical protein